MPSRSSSPHLPRPFLCGLIFYFNASSPLSAVPWRSRSGPISLNRMRAPICGGMCITCSAPCPLRLMTHPGSVTDGEQLQWNPAASYRFDVADFERLSAAQETLPEASLYTPAICYPISTKTGSLASESVCAICISAI